MKYLVIFFGLLISSTCQIVAASPQVDEFTVEETSVQGCSMALRKADSQNKNLYVLFNGIKPNSMEMKIDGKMTQFNRVRASGESFYGQQTFQSFRNRDRNIQVDVSVTLGKQIDESVEITKGAIAVTQKGQATIPVVGSAGC